MEIDSNILKEFEHVLIIQNEHAQRVKNKEQNAYLNGIITGLNIATDFKYTFDKQKNKIEKLIIDDTLLF